jgi:hypothetical protein
VSSPASFERHECPHNRLLGGVTQGAICQAHRSPIHDGCHDLAGSLVNKPLLLFSERYHHPPSTRPVTMENKGTMGKAARRG